MPYLVWYLVIGFSTSLAAAVTKEDQKNLEAMSDDLIPDGIFHLLGSLIPAGDEDLIRAHSSKIFQAYIEKTGLESLILYEKESLSYFIARKFIGSGPKPVPSSKLEKSSQEFLMRLNDHEMDLYFYKIFSVRRNYLKPCLLAVLISVKFYQDEPIYNSDLVDIVNKIYPNYFTTMEVGEAEAHFLKTIDWKLFF